MSIHTATSEASRVYSISLFIMHTFIPMSDCIGYWARIPLKFSHLFFRKGPTFCVHPVHQHVQRAGTHKSKLKQTLSRNGQGHVILQSILNLFAAAQNFPLLLLVPMLSINTSYHRRRSTLVRHSYITRKHSNCECIATWRPPHVAPLVLGSSGPLLYCACAPTASSELSIKILTSPLDSTTPIS